MLAVTLPTALPMASSDCPCAAAMVDTSSSGRVVARLTTVGPNEKLWHSAGGRHPAGGVHKQIAALYGEHQTK